MYDDSIVDIPQWGEIQVSPNGWRIQKMFFAQCVTSFYCAPGTDLFFGLPYWPEPPNFSRFIFNLPESVAGKIGFHTEKMNMRHTPWTTLANGYQIARQGREVFILTPPKRLRIWRWEFTTRKGISVYAGNLTEAESQLLFDYVSSF